MKRKSVFRPCVVTLEDRLAPGSLLTASSLDFGAVLLEGSRLDAPDQRGWQVNSRPSRASFPSEGADDAPSLRIVALANPPTSGIGREADFRGATVMDQGTNASGETPTAWNWDIGNNPFATDILNEANRPTQTKPAFHPSATTGTMAEGGTSTLVGAGAAPSFSPTIRVAAVSAITATPAATSTGVSSVNFKTEASSPTGGHDPYLDYVNGDSYTPDTGMDRQTFMARYRATHQNAPLDGPGRASPGGATTGSPDPGASGPYAVTTQQYDFGDTAFQPTDFVGLPGSPRVELDAEVKAPTDLSNGPFPLIVLMHGRHATTYDPTTNAAFLEWPPAGNHRSIPSYLGYEYLADSLASNGYVVVSIGANGINSRDNNVNDLGALARAELMQRHFNIWNDLSTGSGVVQPFGIAPFGTRFVGEVNMQDIGIMGHSRGGEGVVKSYLYNQSLGSPYGIQAVFALAPVDFNRPVINNVPEAILLPYNDGDVSDLQGAHFYDDARYNVAGDSAAKYTYLVHGANHNFYNSIWTPGGFPAGASDDGQAGPPTRLTPAQERGTGLALMSGFFRAYLGGESQFQPFLRGDVAPPPSAQVTKNQLYTSYQPADNGSRLDVNRLVNPSTLITNTLGGAVNTNGLDTYRVYGDTAAGETGFIFPGEPSTKFPHTIPSARSARSGMSQLQVAYTGAGAYYENDIPAVNEDVSGFYALQFRAGVVFTDTTHNPVGQPQDFSVTLTDALGDSYSTQVSTWSNALYFPPGGATVHQVLSTVRVPLAAFVYGGVDLTQVTQVEFDFDQRTSGSYLLDDLAFTDPNNLYAGPYVQSNSPGGVVTFNTPIDPASFTPDQVTVIGPSGEDVPVNAVTVDPSSPSTRFTISFAATVGGDYTATIGPNVTDLNGTPMDQDFDGIPGEVTDSAVVTFTVAAPQVTSFVRAGRTQDPATSVRVTFNEPINPDTFTPDQVTSFTDPNGTAIAVSGVAPVGGTNNTQFDVTFPQQTTTGVYTMVVGPDIYDTFGIRMAAAFRGTFGIIPQYSASGVTYENNDINGQTGTQAVTFTSGSQYADDDFGPINLGTDSFGYYGSTFTGANQLFVSSNGLITFRNGNSAFTNTNLTATPLEAAIAPLWSDWIKAATDSGGPMILYKFQDVSGGGRRLIIEWNQIHHFPTTPRQITFQAILTLNTGGTPGDIYFNYLDIDTGASDPNREGLTSAVGIKDAGPQDPNTGSRTLVSFNAANPLVGTRKEIRLHL